MQFDYQVLSSNDCQWSMKETFHLCYNVSFRDVSRYLMLFDWIRHLYVISVYDHVEIVVIMHICKITYNNGSVIMEQWSKTRHRFISAMLLQKCYKRWCIRSFFNDLRSKNTSRLLYNTRRYTGSLLLFFFSVSFSQEENRAGNFWKWREMLLRKALKLSPSQVGVT